MKTRIGKERDGWEAVSELPLTEKQVLTIRTYKRHGLLDTTANVGSLGAGGLLTYVLGRDYSALLCRRSGSRATEKAVSEQHQTVLASLEEVKAKAIGHYAEQARKVQHAAA